MYVLKVGIFSLIATINLPPFFNKNLTAPSIPFM